MSIRKNDLRINETRFWASMARSAEIGKGRTTGLSRLALGDADKEMRDIFVGWCKEAGLEVTVDRMGSIFARRKGEPPAARPGRQPPGYPDRRGQL
jgi:N-carbamoyl-L-amino-acid hydrolase